MTGPRENQAKGHELERALEAIERAILDVSPESKDKPFKIWNRRVEVIDGVRHEIDLWVDVLAPGYTSTFIFECKNWEATVGKNEVIILSEKIDAVAATRGFLVAKRFSRDARAQAKKDPRLALLLARQFAPSVADLLLKRIISTMADQFTFSFGGRVLASEHIPAARAVGAHSRATVKGEGVDLVAHLRTYVERVLERLDCSPAALADMLPGIYPLCTWGRVDCADDQLVLDGVFHVESVHVRAEVEIHIVQPVFRTTFDVESRGRVTFMEPTEAHGVAFEAVVIRKHVVGP